MISGGKGFLSDDLTVVLSGELRFHLFQNFPKSYLGIQKDFGLYRNIKGNMVIVQFLNNIYI